MDHEKSVLPQLALGEHVSLVNTSKQALHSADIQLPLPHYLHTRKSKVRRVWWKGAFIASLVVLATLWLQGYRFCLPIPKQPHTPVRNPAYLIEAEHGAVATENLRCSNIAVDVLKEGGTAIDAVISATFCVGVVNMFS